jgi:hypothetical protein
VRAALSRRELGAGSRLLPVRAVEAAGARGAVDLEPDARVVVSLDAPPVGEAIDDVKAVAALSVAAGLTRPLLRVEPGPGVCDLDPDALGRGRGMELDLLGLRVQNRVRHQLADQQVDVVAKVTERAVEASERGTRSCGGGGPTGQANGEGLVQKPMRILKKRLDGQSVGARRPLHSNSFEACGRSVPGHGRRRRRSYNRDVRGRSVVVAQKPSKLLGRVRFPSPASREEGYASHPRGVAQSGSAFGWGQKGRWFKSSRPDSLNGPRCRLWSGRAVLPPKRWGPFGVHFRREKVPSGYGSLR